MSLWVLSARVFSRVFLRKVSMRREIVVASEVRVKVSSPRASPAPSCASRTARRYRRRVAKRARNELGTRRRSFVPLPVLRRWTTHRRFPRRERRAPRRSRCSSESLPILPRYRRRRTSRHPPRIPRAARPTVDPPTRSCRADPRCAPAEPPPTHLTDDEEKTSRRIDVEGVGEAFKNTKQLSSDGTTRRRATRVRALAVAMASPTPHRMALCALARYLGLSLIHI